jgi:Pumilio-family RNA binding repeat
MQHGWEADRAVLIREVQTNLLDFSQHKFASNVVEKCLQYASKRDRDEMIWTIINVTFDLKNPVDAKTGDEKTFSTSSFFHSYLSCLFCRHRVLCTSEFTCDIHFISVTSSLPLSTMLCTTISTEYLMFSFTISISLQVTACWNPWCAILTPITSSRRCDPPLFFSPFVCFLRH